MRLFTLAALATLIAMPAKADERQVVDNIGQCLVFAYVRLGLDGEKAIPADMEPLLNHFKDAYEVRAANIGVDETQRQQFVVEALYKQNLLVQEQGLPALNRQYQQLCDNVASALDTELMMDNSSSNLHVPPPAQ